MAFPAGAVEYNNVLERIIGRAQDDALTGDMIVRTVTAEISRAVTERASSWAGAERLARQYARSHARTGYYLHAFVADTIANDYRRQKESEDG